MKSVFLLVLSTGLSIVLIETFLIWEPELQAPLPYSHFIFCSLPPQLAQPHDLFGWTAIPDSAYFEQKSEADGWAVYIYNAEGFRDLFDSGDEHVIVLGDSFTQGANVNNDEAFPHLLDSWNPDLAFHNYGTGGYGTKNSLSAYEAVSARIPHRLVILAYFLGNDLRDNLTVHGQDTEPRPSDQANYSRLKNHLRTINSVIRENIRFYNLLYSAIRPAFGKFDLPDAKIEQGAKITGDLLMELARSVRSNNSDLLIVILPSWNQLSQYDNPREMLREKNLLHEISDRWDNVYLIDMSDLFSQRDLSEIYGIKDRHFSRYGYYLTAKAVHEWINSEWPRGNRRARQSPSFRGPAAPIDPDCALIPEYRKAFASPRGRPGRSVPDRRWSGTAAGQATQ